MNTRLTTVADPPDIALAQTENTRPKLALHLIDNEMYFQYRPEVTVFGTGTLLVSLDQDMEPGWGHRTDVIVGAIRFEMAKLGECTCLVTTQLLASSV